MRVLPDAPHLAMPHSLLRKIEEFRQEEVRGSAWNGLDERYERARTWTRACLLKATLQSCAFWRQPNSSRVICGSNTTSWEEPQVEILPTWLRFEISMLTCPSTSPTTPMMS